MTALHTRRAWIFDLDGTLTVPQHNFDAIRIELGIPKGSLILEYLDTLPAAEAHVIHQRLNTLEAELAGQSQPAAGVRELLQTLRDTDRRVGILTRNTRDNALVSLDAIGVADLVDPTDVLGRNECAAKPDPAGIALLLSRWRRTASDAVMVGDYLLDLQAGRAAGSATVHVDVMDRRWPELTDHYTRSLHQVHTLATPG